MTMPAPKPERLSTIERQIGVDLPLDDPFGDAVWPESTEALPQRAPWLPPLLRNRQLWLTVIAVALGLGLWEGLWLSNDIPAYMLPSPASVWHEWVQLWRVGVMWHDVAATLKEALIGFAVAFVIGVGLGYPLARSRVMDEILAPYLAASQAMPVIAFAPLLVVWFGLGLLPKVIICVLIVFFPILINTAVGFREVDPTMMQAARGLGANEFRTFWHVELPLALRTLLGGVKMGLTLAMTGAVVGEFVAADAGLGYLMNLGRTQYDAAMVFAAALTMAGVAILGYVGVTALERLLIRWE